MWTTLLEADQATPLTPPASRIIVPEHPNFSSTKRIPLEQPKIEHQVRNRMRTHFPPQLANWYNYGAGGYQTIDAPPNASQGKGVFTRFIGTKIFSTLTHYAAKTFIANPDFQ
ncbi:hypothetical protein I7I51_00034 [Histoplasma capsulatum]|uniref:Uncharacterized protein n=1 Tax=Ajellomyces capsulatus TaxID=5037 RepID=A0A8A1MAK0_AJECA|nr:hypothetical protein I7I51_00034 [Histoplasma capsulatum]